MEHNPILIPFFWLTRVGLAVLYVLRDLWHRPDRSFFEGPVPIPESKIRHTVEAAPDLPTHRYEFGAAAVGKTVYVAGGIFQPSVWLPTGRFEAFDTTTNTWSTKPSMPYVVHHPGVAADGRFVYVVGGCGIRIIPRNEVTRFDPQQNSWTYLSPMPTKRGALGVACIGNFLYAVGGADYNKKYATLERYDIANDTWTTLSPMPTPREHLAVAVSAGKLHVLGGYATDRFGSLTTHEIYDPITDKWKKGAPLPMRLCGFAAAALGNEILTFGGEQGWAVVPFVLSYNTKTESWSRLPDLREPRYAAAAAECNGAVHVFGGNTRMFSNDFSRHHDVFSR